MFFTSNGIFYQKCFRVYLFLYKGWRPRRTIKLCSWGAEEQGLIGSIEWVEQQSKVVRERAVAYINIDAVVRGNYSLSAKGDC